MLSEIEIRCGEHNVKEDNSAFPTQVTSGFEKAFKKVRLSGCNGQKSSNSSRIQSKANLQQSCNNSDRE